MFRKAITTLAFAMVFGSAACNNSIVGPKDITSTGGAPAPRPHPPVERDKVCIDDLRGVQITSPSESQSVRVGDNVAVTWVAKEFCTGFVATARVSYDGGSTWSTLGVAKNALSATWRIPSLAHIRPIVEVTLEDAAYEQYTATIALRTGILDAPSPGHVPPVERD